MMGYQKTAALHAAVDLQVFTAIGAGASTVESIAEKCGSSQRGIRILCDYLVIEGLLAKESDKYLLTAGQRHLPGSKVAALHGWNAAVSPCPTLLASGSALNGDCAYGPH